MTRALLERRARAEHTCPRCGAQRHFSCRQLFLNGEMRFLAHPHRERLDLARAKEEEEGK